MRSGFVVYRKNRVVIGLCGSDDDGHEPSGDHLLGTCRIMIAVMQAMRRERATPAVVTVASTCLFVRPFLAPTCRCGDCSFGSLILVRPLKAREAAPGDTGTGDGGDLWAVPVRVDSAGPLPLSQARILHFALLGTRVIV